jgi:Na+/proline symporter
VRARDPRVHYRRRVILAVIGFLLGVGLLVAGVIIKYIPMGVAGFLVMLTCALWALTSWRHMTGLGPRGAPAAARKRRSRSRSRTQPTDQGFMERLEERWRRRQEGDR